MSSFLPNRLPDFITELKRRRVFRVATIYAGAAFVVVQVADIFVPALHLPEWTMTLLVVLVILGLPVALALAWAYDVTMDVARTESEPPAPARSASRHARVALSGLIVLAVLASVWIGWRSWFSGPAVVLDPDVVAVAPFRVAGAEPALAYLREGMLDLLAAKLTSETGPRAVDPRTLISAWQQAAVDGADLPREQALALARRLGAARLVLGEVVSLPGRVVLTAALMDVRTGRGEAPVSVEGAVDSLPALVDRLVAGLLSVGSGETERLATLTTTSLPALRHYLEGQAAYRGGRYTEANTLFGQALEADSTFALAALMKHRALLWVAGTASAGDPAALALSWRRRDRLGPDDAALLAAVAGPRYPAWTPANEWASAWEALVRRRPDSPDAWFEWGDFAFLHWGTQLGLADTTARRRAAEAFDRALALDSTYLTPLAHLFDIAMIRGDTSAARRYGELYLVREPRGPVAVGIRSVRAALTQGMAAVPAIIATIDSLDALRRFPLITLSFHPATLPQAYAIAEHSADEIRDPDVARDVAVTLTHLALNRGRPAEAVRLVEAGRAAMGMDSVVTLTAVVRFSLHAGGDTATASRAAAVLAPRLRGVPNYVLGVDAACVLGQWQADRGNFAAAAEMRDRLHSVDEAADISLFHRARLCAALLDSWVAVGARDADAADRLARLDALLATHFATQGNATWEAKLVLARLLESRGDHAGALRALRTPAYTGAFMPYHATFLRERGHLATLLGDSAAAVAAYREYLAMHSDPEPALRADDEAVRAQLKRLAGG